MSVGREAGLATSSGAPPLRCTVPRLGVVGEWPLARLLMRRAARRGWPVTLVPGATPPRLVLETDDERFGGSHENDVALPTAVELSWAIAAAGVRRVLASCASAAGQVECVVLAPAAGWCGASDAGPIDAIRIEGVRSLSGQGGSTAVRLRLLTTPQTRCWIAICTFAETVVHATEGAPGLVGPLGPAVSDTARLTQLMYDRGHGRDWDQLALLGAGADAGSVLAAFTDALYVDDLLQAAASACRSGDGA